MLIQRTISRRRVLILSTVLIVVAVAGLVFASRRFVNRPEGTNVTNTAPPVNISLSQIVNINTGILSDPRLLELRARGGFSASSQTEVRVEDPTAPSAPENVRVFDPGTGGVLTVTWTLPADARITGVRLYRSTDPTGLVEKLADLGATVTGYQDESVTNGQTFYYVVRSTTTDNRESTNTTASAGRASDLIAPQPPTNVKVESVDGGKAVVVSWTNTTDSDFSHVRVYRSSTKGTLGSIRFDLVTEQSVRDDSVVPGEEYFYTIVSVDKAGNASGVNLTSTPGKANPFLPSF